MTAIKLDISGFFKRPGKKFLGSEIEALGQIPLMDSHGLPVPRLFKEGMILRPGTFNETFEVDEAYILELVRNFKPKDPPPIQVSHSTSAYDTHGFTRIVAAVDAPLFDDEMNPVLNPDGSHKTEVRLNGVLEFRGEEAVKAVEAGLWNKLSGGFFREPAQMFELSVTPFPAVGINGGDPARILSTEKVKGTEASPSTIKGAKKMSFTTKLFSLLRRRARGEEANLESIAKEADLTAEELEGEVQELMNLTAAKEEAQETQEAEDGAEGTEESIMLSASPEVQAILKANQERIAALEAKQLEDAKIVRLKEDTAAVESLVASKHLLPKDNEAALAFLSTCSQKQADMWVALQSSTAEKVETGRKSTPMATKPGSSSATVQQEVEKLHADSGYSKDENGQWVRA